MTQYVSVDLALAARLPAIERGLLSASFIAVISTYNDWANH
jgi:hypothetical protein